MTVFVFVLAVGVCLGALSLVFAIERKQCPVCLRRAVAMRFTDGYSQGDVHIVSFRCTRCRAELRTLNGGPLIPREAFDDGVRAPVPAARVVPR